MYWTGVIVVWLYEFIGTFGLLMAVNATNGDAVGTALVFFLLLKLAAPVSGAHFNPSVTMGVFINFTEKKNWARNLIQLFSMWTAQIIGGIISAEIMFLVLEDHAATIEELQAAFPHLEPHTPEIWQTFMFEVLCTFIFVMANLMVKDRRAE